MFEELGPQFEETLLTVASNFMNFELKIEEEIMQVPVDQDRNVSNDFTELFDSSWHRPG